MKGQEEGESYSPLIGADFHRPGPGLLNHAQTEGVHNGAARVITECQVCLDWARNFKDMIDTMKAIEKDVQ